ncbi:MAG: glycine cleavage system aminomethyltransferase GcvT [Propionibacteriales bacterium]|nr:glycine cleavage system aminomethyltransferase GcvT [Propionibacteriales bacterium]
MSSGFSGLMRSPLHGRHVELGAKTGEFGGWEMPLEYAGGGVLKEHAAVRERVGVFDVSHLGKATASGPGAAEFVNGCLAGDLEKITPGQAQYTLCCDESGGVVDDLIVYLRGPDEVFFMPNAANTAEVVSRLTERTPEGVRILSQHGDFGVLAVQGPRSDETLEAVGLPVGHDYMAFADAAFDGATVAVCRTGYTGERGYELVVPSEKAVALWDAVLRAGEPYGILPCGLGARDTLRTEMGYPLHGQDLSLDITPVQARMGWAVGWRKPRFWGREALLAEREAGPARRLWGLRADGRRMPRPGMTVLGGDDGPVGAVTSGTFSPTLRIGLGLALLDSTVEVGQRVSIDVRGRREAFEVAKPPFVPSHVR